MQRVRTVGLSVASVGVNAAASLIIVPILLQHLGRERYGQWAMISAVVAYFLVLDFGLNSATGRLLAAAKGRKDPGGAQTVFFASVFLSGALVPFIFLVAMATAFVFPLVFALGADAADVQRAIVIVSFGTMTYFMCAPFYALLWSEERFDVIGFFDILAALVRTCVIFLVLSRTQSLSAVALATVAPNCGFYILTAVTACIRYRAVVGRLRFSKRSDLLDVLRYGRVNFLANISRTAAMQAAPLVVGATLGTNTVAAYAIARQLVQYGTMASSAALQLLGPRAAVLQVSSKTELQRMFNNGCSMAWSLSLLAASALVYFGPGFLHLWQSQISDAGPILVILAIIEFLPNVMMVAFHTLLGMNRFETVIKLSLLEVACYAVIAPLVSSQGLVATALALAASGAAIRGVIYFRTACRALNLSQLSVTAAVLAANWPELTLTICAGALLYWVWPIGTWTQLFGYALPYGAIYSAVMLRHLNRF